VLPGEASFHEKKSPGGGREGWKGLFRKERFSVLKEKKGEKKSQKEEGRKFLYSLGRGTNSVKGSFTSTNERTSSERKRTKRFR